MTPEFLALVLQSVEPLQELIPLLLGHFDFDRSRALGGFLDIDMPGAALSVVLNVVCCCRRIVVIIQVTIELQFSHETLPQVVTAQFAQVVGFRDLYRVGSNHIVDLATGHVLDICV